MENQMVFNRYELKYLINAEQKKKILEASNGKIRADEHGKSTICNLYFDTPDFLLIRHSIEKPVYKEKLRMRTYGIADADTSVFIELKKKYKSVVYKRRVTLPYKEVRSILIPGRDGQSVGEKQISNEIRYVFSHYDNLEPRVFLAYDREAFYSIDDSDFRITFDNNIIWRKEDLTLSSSLYGEKLLDEGLLLMELKTSRAIPLWFTKLLADNKIYKTSFSKYGTVYQKCISDSRYQQKDAVI